MKICNCPTKLEDMSLIGLHWLCGPVCNVAAWAAAFFLITSKLLENRAVKLLQYTSSLAPISIP